MTREESIKRLNEQTFKELAKEPSEDFISREQAIDALGECPMNWTDSDGEVTAERDWKDTVKMLKSLPSVNPQEPYKDFCEFVAKMVLRDDFEENVGANAKFLCRKLSKLGIVKADEDKWVLVESEVSK